MGPMMETLAGGFRFSNFIMNLVAKDITDEDARKRSRGTEGASVAWVVGHLIHYRRNVMAFLGSPKPDSYASRFGNAAATDGADYPTMAELLADWNRVAEELEAAMANIDDEYLTTAADGSGPHGEKRRIDDATFFLWHESYHMGQLGTLRKNLGYEATADLAVAAKGG